jgi:hypothetical protein
MIMKQRLTKLERRLGCFHPSEVGLRLAAEQVAADEWVDPDELLRVHRRLLQMQHAAQRAGRGAVTLEECVAELAAAEGIEAPGQP